MRIKSVCVGGGGDGGESNDIFLGAVLSFLSGI